MNEEYLWNRTGEPDPEIAHLEEALRPLRFEPDLARLQLPVLKTSLPTRRFRMQVWGTGVALAAAALIIGISVVVYVRTSHSSAPSGWRISWNGSSSHALRSGHIVE